MDVNTAASLVPPLDEFGIPAPAWVFVFLMNLTLVLHFLLLGYVFTITLMGAFWSLGGEGSHARWMLRKTERFLPVALSFAITLGVAPLLFVQVLYHSFFYTANIIIGYQWLGIVPVLIAGFYLIYMLQGGVFMGRPIPRAAEALGRLAIFLCIVYVGVTHTTNALLALHPERWQAAREAGGTTLGLMDLPAFWPRLLHNFLALLVIGAVWMINMGVLSARRMGGEGREAASARALARLGGLVAAVGILFEMFAGIWLFVAEGQGIAIQKVLFAGTPAAILWMISLGAGLVLLLVAAMALAQNVPGWVMHAAGSVLLLLLGGMFAGREAVRQAWLAPYFKMSAWPVRLQVSSLVLFLVAFVAALVLVGVMVYWLRRAYAAAELGKAEEAAG